MTRSQYFQDSRSPRYAILFAAPLLLCYELSAWLLSDSHGTGVRNGADVLLKSLFIRMGGRGGVLAFAVILAFAGGFLIVRDWRRYPGPLKWRTFPLMLLESVGLGIAIGFVLRYATSALLNFSMLATPDGLGKPTELMVSLGAGIYEELLFRVILVGVLSLLATRMFGWGTRGAGIFAVLVSALVFSAFHYIGAYGDTLQLASFLFRFLAGLLFSTLYVLRGFGITAWTHALYDVIVTVS